MHEAVARLPRFVVEPRPWSGLVRDTPCNREPGRVSLPLRNGHLNSAATSTIRFPRFCTINRFSLAALCRGKPEKIEWLSDNGSGYTADDTRRFAAAIGLKPLTTPVCSPQSNGMAESFVKTMKRDYVAFMPKPDAATAARNLAIAFEHYNEKHPHSALKYRSPRAFRRSMDSATLV